MWEKGKFVFVTSTEIIEEVIRVLHYPKIKKSYKLSDLDIQNVEISLGLDTMLVSGKLKVDKIKEDPEDNKFLSCALEGNADYIVTGDKHLLKIKSFHNVQIITPKYFLIKYQRTI
ncbi:MAG: putative toxin-antitoxin system toxin component, PIN family [Candidatus Cloacimonetes bacterium]|nr:putative toxin-antitoxin system toxin component, PIN family [Candidatus Cloacimonadota bacterium]MBL7085492.1 putative toxin-antitoxin system toxin component, PIN family [Candidatus Cloacimonadota bacterium]